jgi:hypothetical protein
MSEQEPGPTHTPYGQDPYGAPPQGSPYGQQPAGYGQSPYGQQPAKASADRPGTVTAAAWITIVCSGLVLALFGLMAIGLLVAHDEIVRAVQDELDKQATSPDVTVDVDSVIGALWVFVAIFVFWTVSAIVLSVFVLKRSNAARIMLVISSSVTALLSLVSIMTIVPAVPLIASVAVIIMLFAGGASDWFRGYQTYGGLPVQQYPSAGGYGYSSSGSPDPYGASNPYPQGTSQNPYGQSSYDQGGYEPYGGQPSQPAPSENPYGQPTSGSDGSSDADGSDYPPKDYPGR